MVEVVNFSFGSSFVYFLMLVLFDLGLTSLSTFFSHIATVFNVGSSRR